MATVNHTSTGYVSDTDTITDSISTTVGDYVLVLVTANHASTNVTISMDSSTWALVAQTADGSETTAIFESKQGATSTSVSMTATTNYTCDNIHMCAISVTGASRAAQVNYYVGSGTTWNTFYDVTTNATNQIVFCTFASESNPDTGPSGYSSTGVNITGEFYSRLYYKAVSSSGITEGALTGTLALQGYITTIGVIGDFGWNTGGSARVQFIGI